MAVIDGAAIRYTGFVAEIRVDVNDVARELDVLLARMEAGDAVLVERNGATVATLAPCGRSAEAAAFAKKHGVPEPGERSLRAFLWERLKQPRWSDEDYDAFIADLETARELLNGEPRNIWDE